MILARLKAKALIALGALSAVVAVILRGLYLKRQAAAAQDKANQAQQRAAAHQASAELHRLGNQRLRQIKKRHRREERKIREELNQLAKTPDPNKQREHLEGEW